MMSSGNVTLYLPPDILRQAKALNLPLSRMLRSAVLREIEVREVKEREARNGLLDILATVM